MFNSIRLLVYLVLMTGSFLLLLPPLQSSPESVVSFLPMGVISTGIFTLSCLVEPRKEDNPLVHYGVISFKSVAFFVFAWLVFERVQTGVIS